MTGTMPFSLDKVLPELPAWLAIIATFIVMIGLAIAVERIVLRPLVNQDHIIMFMSTIGLAFVLEGLGDTIWGSEVKALDVGIPSGSFMVGEIQIQVFDLWKRWNSDVSSCGASRVFSPHALAEHYER